MELSLRAKALVGVRGSFAGCRDPCTELTLGWGHDASVAPPVEVSVLVDVHEARSGVSEAIARLGVRVVELALPVGDYEVGEGVLVERKSVRDLHHSVATGRFWA